MIPKLFERGFVQNPLSQLPSRDSSNCIACALNKIVITHNPDHCLMLGGNVAVLDRKGHLCYGQVSEIITEERLHSIYNTDITIRFFAEAGRPICIPTKRVK